MVKVNLSGSAKDTRGRRDGKLYSWARQSAMIFLLCAIASVLFTMSGVRDFAVEGLGKPSDRVANVHVGSRADWDYGKGMPEFCKVLLKDPFPFHKSCRRNGNTMEKSLECRNGTRKYRMFSQYQQDDFLYVSHFKHLRRPGIYLDIAANNPIGISNTFFMDRCLGWQGICVEANPEYHERLYRERSCHLVPTCVGSRDGESVEFGLKGGIGGIIGDTFKHTKSFKKKGTKVPVMKARCTTMKKVLERNAITVVDYLSLDVEGHELEVLKGFDWDKVVVNLMTIEVSRKSVKGIEKFLIPKGYRRFAFEYNGRGDRKNFMTEEAVFLHETVEFGKPR